MRSRLPLYAFLPLAPFAFAACEQAAEPEQTAASSVVQSSVAADDYRAIDLGTLGGVFSFATAINDGGEIVGYSGERAFLWKDGAMADLGTLYPSCPSGGGSRAMDINARGQVVGYSWCDSRSRPFVWEDGVMMDLGTLGGDRSAAHGINNRGQVVGWSQTADGQYHAFLWQRGVMTKLRTPGGVVITHAADINESGQVVGTCYTADGKWPGCLWKKGWVRTLSLLQESYPSAINDRGQVVGETEVGDLAVLWEKGLESYLVPGVEWSAAWGINDRGQVVGQCQVPEGVHAFLWEKGAVIDLGTLGGARSFADDINNRGQVVGGSVNASGEFHATLWTR
jgi:probable HAF family extracellular repeat protein